ncbi:hypothetical protein OHS33_01215 [Streptomyces sp. NBC_00536]|uniref:hypothetical protein n=1 Tax=Streptomyces sp. NBC_00536 TaxID=2975769 RepID=UPI002E80DAC3|nr:hypothetical protein [Streptomyces sp. NBC_00536]WUC77087.1 hypothetical protein OHS33_01215 [Streptomyces sp. NBC_00536]
MTTAATPDTAVHEASYREAFLPPTTVLLPHRWRPLHDLVQIAGAAPTAEDAVRAVVEAEPRMHRELPDLRNRYRWTTEMTQGLARTLALLAAQCGQDRLPERTPALTALWEAVTTRLDTTRLVSWPVLLCRANAALPTAPPLSITRFGTLIRTAAEMERLAARTLSPVLSTLTAAATHPSATTCAVREVATLSREIRLHLRRAAGHMATLPAHPGERRVLDVLAATVPMQGALPSRFEPPALQMSDALLGLYEPGPGSAVREPALRCLNAEQLTLLRQARRIGRKVRATAATHPTCAQQCRTTLTQLAHARVALRELAATARG